MKILSIITINKNNVTGLEKTIQSVVCQTSDDFEYIIIDGASDDGSVEIIQKYENNINFWVSESDTGIYNAMNKGIRKAHGKFCLFLNSGDWLISPETLDNVFKEIKGNSSDIFYSDVILSDGRTKHFQKLETIYHLLATRLNHQNAIIRRSLFFEHLFYNEELCISSDWEFFLNEFSNYKSVFHKLKTNISVYDIQGISNQNEKRNAEDFIVYHNVFGDFADIVIENIKFRYTTYYNIIANYGDTKLLTFLLRIYRKSFEIIKQIIFIFQKSGKN